MNKLSTLCVGLATLWVGAFLSAPANPTTEVFKEVSCVARLTLDTEYNSPMTGSAVPFLCEKREKDGFSIYLLTAKHLTYKSKNLKIEFFMHKTREGYLFKRDPTYMFDNVSVVAEHPEKDIAIIKLVSDVKLPVLELSDREPQCMEKVFASGCPLGTSLVVTEGRIMTRSVLSGWMATAPIVPGNSGGAVISKKTRKLLGISTSIFMTSAMGDQVYHMHGFVPVSGIWTWIPEVLAK